MQTINNRQFTNQLPKWAIGLMVILIILFGVISLGIFLWSIWEWSHTGFTFLVLFFMAGLFLWLSHLSYKNLRLYLDYIFKIDLGDQGYYYYMKDKKKNEEVEIFLPYERMEYVLIGQDYRFEPKYSIGYERTKVTFMAIKTAKVLMYGESSEGKSEVLSFTLSSSHTVDDWIGVFLHHHVPVYHTDYALTATANTPEAIQQVPKQLYEGSLPFVPGTTTEKVDHFHMTEKQTELLQKNKKIRKRKARFFKLLLVLFQIVLISLWFPHWEIQDGMFQDNSRESLVGIATIFTLFFIYAYVGVEKWYDPLKDMAIIDAGMVIATVFSQANHPDFPAAVMAYGLTINILTLSLFYLGRLIDWIKKFLKMMP